MHHQYQTPDKRKTYKKSKCYSTAEKGFTMVTFYKAYIKQLKNKKTVRDYIA